MSDLVGNPEDQFSCVAAQTNPVQKEVFSSLLKLHALMRLWMVHTASLLNLHALIMRLWMVHTVVSAIKASSQTR